MPAVTVPVVPELLRLILAEFMKFCLYEPGEERIGFAGGIGGADPTFPLVVVLLLLLVEELVPLPMPPPTDPGGVVADAGGCVADIGALILS